MSPLYSFLVVFGFICALTSLSSADDVKTIVLNNKEYYVGVSNKVNWYRAVQTCAAYDMSLASIESNEEYESLRQYLFNNKQWGTQFWLSGTNLPDRSNYVWLTSGKRISYEKWAQSPSTLANQCVRTNGNFLWVTGACTDSLYFICSRPVEPACGVFGRCLYTHNPNAKTN
ncbi:C-type lectin 37Da-like [Musca vetustissima]|uniref:C-type lectin 37Da-like n=1 Tax=Musca vetustissima TaxID=27455 RepID=UPI002AB7A495|nr:C-type lectin 37Da-like [Musca vetustissima]